MWTQGWSGLAAGGLANGAAGQMADASPNTYARGLALSALGMIILSPDALLLRLVEDAGVWDVIFFRTLFMGLSLGLVLAISHGARIPRLVAGAGRALAFSALLMGASNMTFVGAITHTSVANTLLILATMPLFSAVLGWWLIGERVRPRTWAAIAAAFAGVVVIFSDSLGGGHWAGDLMAASTAFLQGLNLVVLRKAGRGIMMPALCLSGFLAAALAWPMAAPASVTAADLAILAVLGFAILPLSLALFLGGTAHVPAAEVALLALIETVLGPLWVWIGIGETPTAMTLAGGVVVVAAIVLNAALALRRRRGVIEPWGILMRRTALFLALCCLAAPLSAFELQGHRGARGLAPENTLAAFAIGLGIGVTALELDVGVSRDGVVVVAHDLPLNPALARRPDGTWLDGPGPALHALTFAELRTWDVGRLDPGHTYARRFPEQAPEDGARMPSLAEVIGLVRRAGNRTVRLNVEIKMRPDAPRLTLAPQPFAEAVVRVLRAEGVAGRATIQSFDWRALRHVQRIAPDIPTVYLSAQQKWLDNIETGKPGPSPWTAGLDVDDYEGSVPRLVKAAGGAVGSPFHREVDRARIAATQALGLAVIAWTVNDEARMSELINLGVDGIITDYPDRLRQLMRKRGMALPPATPVEP